VPHYKLTAGSQSEPQNLSWNEPQRGTPITVSLADISPIPKTQHNTNSAKKIWSPRKQYSEILTGTSMKNKVKSASFEAFRTVEIQVKVFWVVMPCILVVATNVSGVHASSIFRVKLVPYHNTKRRHNPGRPRLEGWRFWN